VSKMRSSPTTDLRQILLQFQKDDYLCDAVLVADDGRMKAHSIVLAAASSVFKESLKSDQKPDERIIVLPGLLIYELKIIVHFAYTGDIVIPKKYMTTDAPSRVVNVLIELGFNLSAVETR
jgi:BTB/POZ domain